eukprot:GHVT01048501.1.p1 GENE.GHVT01048501.1~~GHVT01048501.1.p1  ORF type:complete len:161 (+),score=25.09 GHVT01048501.1:246-728(+)
MPSCGPIKLKTPGPERWRLTKSSIPPLWQADVRLGKSLVASAPQCVKDKHLENIRSHFRRLLGKGKEVMINVHATFARTKKVDGCKMGNGKGEINHYVARVPAGQKNSRKKREGKAEAGIRGKGRRREEKEGRREGEGSQPTKCVQPIPIFWMFFLHVFF